LTGFSWLCKSIPTYDMPSAQLNGTSIHGGNVQSWTRCTKPMVYSGSLDSYTQRDMTPVIGREFEGMQVVNLLKASDSDRLIKDLAVTGKSFPTLARYAVRVSNIL